MNSAAPCLNASEAAKRLGVSTKALRLYEKHGLLAPKRTSAGYRVYGPKEMLRATEIIALRALDLSLTQVERVLNGDAESLATALAVHEATLEDEINRLGCKIDKVRRLRKDVARGQMPDNGELLHLLDHGVETGGPFEHSRHGASGGVNFATNAGNSR